MKKFQKFIKLRKNIESVTQKAIPTEESNADLEEFPLTDT